MKYLLKWKNEPEAVNTPNNAGRTCLHIAAIINNLPLCKLLLDNGAEKNSLMMHKVVQSLHLLHTQSPYSLANPDVGFFQRNIWNFLCKEDELLDVVMRYYWIWIKRMWVRMKSISKNHANIHECAKPLNI